MSTSSSSPPLTVLQTEESFLFQREESDVLIRAGGEEAEGPDARCFRGLSKLEVFFLFIVLFIHAVETITLAYATNEYYKRGNDIYFGLNVTFLILPTVVFVIYFLFAYQSALSSVLTGVVLYAPLLLLRIAAPVELIYALFCGQSLSRRLLLGDKVNARRFSQISFLKALDSFFTSFPAMFVQMHYILRFEDYEFVLVSCTILNILSVSFIVHAGLEIYSKVQFWITDRFRAQIFGLFHFGLCAFSYALFAAMVGPHFWIFVVCLFLFTSLVVWYQERFVNLRRLKKQQDLEKKRAQRVANSSLTVHLVDSDEIIEEEELEVLEDENEEDEDLKNYIKEQKAAKVLLGVGEREVYSAFAYWREFLIVVLLNMLFFQESIHQYRVFGFDVSISLFLKYECSFLVALNCGLFIGREGTEGKNPYIAISIIALVCWNVFFYYWFIVCRSLTLVHLAKQETEDSKKLLYTSNAIAIDPNCVRAYRVRARVHLKDSDFEAAVRDFSSVIELSPSFDCYFLRAEGNWELGDYQRSVEDYISAIAYSKNTLQKVSAHTKAYLCFIYMGRYKEAIAHTTKCTAMQKRNPFHHFGRAEAFLLLGDRSRAIQHWADGMQHFDGMLERHTLEKHQIRVLRCFYNGIKLLLEDAYDEAIKEFDSCLHCDSKFEEEVKAYLFLGICFYKKGDYQESLRLLNHWLDLRPRSVPGLFYRSLSFGSMKLETEANRDVWQIQAINPKFAGKSI